MILDLARHKLADAVDAFCETIAFSPEQTRACLQPRRRRGCQSSSTRTSSPICTARDWLPSTARSRPTTLNTPTRTASPLARAGTVAVLLPGAFYVLREKQVPPVDAFRRQRVPIAIATDSNPGTSPLTSLLVVMNMAATLFRLTVDEAIAGVTREAARALGRIAEVGTIEPGKWCDLVIWDIERPAELVYRIGFNPLQARVWRGT
jgi:imidazolonepropionase